MRDVDAILAPRDSPMEIVKILSGTLDSDARETDIKVTRYMAFNETLEIIYGAEGTEHTPIDTNNKSNGGIIHRCLCCKRINALHTTIPSLIIT